MGHCWVLAVACYKYPRAETLVKMLTIEAFVGYLPQSHVQVAPASRRLGMSAAEAVNLKWQAWPEHTTR